MQARNANSSDSDFVDGFDRGSIALALDGAIDHICHSAHVIGALCSTRGPLHDGIGRRAVTSARAFEGTDTSLRTTSLAVW